MYKYIFVYCLVIVYPLTKTNVFEREMTPNSQVWHQVSLTLQQYIER